MKINENCRSFVDDCLSCFSFAQRKLGLILLPLLLFASSYLATAAPSIGVAKDASTAGRQVTFDFYLENLGDEALNDVSLLDDLDAVFGSGNYSIISAPAFVDNPGTLVLNGAYDGSADTEVFSSGTLAVGDTAQVRMIVEITSIVDMGDGLGNYSNQASAGGTGAISSTVVADLSDDGTEPDASGNNDPGDAGEDDPTLFSPLDNPIIGLAKDAKLSGNQVTYDFYLEAFGNRNLQALSLADDLDAVFGAGNYTVTGSPSFIDNPGTISLNASFDGSADQQIISSGTLAIGDTAQIRVVVNITNVTDQGDGLGAYSNQAVASAQSATGAMTTDLSDAGTDPDPDGNGLANQEGENDPTLILVGEEPQVGIALSSSVSGSQVTFDCYVENLGNVSIQNLQVDAALDDVFGAGNYFLSSAPQFISGGAGVALDPDYDGSENDVLFEDGGTLGVGASLQVRMVVRVLNVVDLGSGTGVYSAQAFATGSAAGGDLTMDLSDDGTDPDPNGNGNPDEAGENDPNTITVSPIAKIGLAKTYRATAVGSSVDVELEYRVENIGNQLLSSISITDNLNTVYGAGNYSHLEDPRYVGGSPTFNYNAGFNGNTNTSLLNAGSTLAPGDYVIFRVKSRLHTITDQGFGVGIYQTQNTVNALDPSANPVSDLSDSGTVVDANSNGEADEAGENDPTVIDVNIGLGTPGLALDVSVAGSLVTLDFYLENLDNAAFTELGLDASLDNVFGSGNYVIQSAPAFIDDPGTVTLNASYDGSSDSGLLDIASSSLGIGDTAQIRMVVNVTNVTNQGLGGGNYSASYELTAKNGSGSLETDTSDFGTDPDPDGDGNPDEAGENDATTFSLAVDSPVGVAMDVSVSDFDVTLDLYLENLGSSTASSVSLTQNLDDVFGAGNYAITVAPAFIVDPGTLVLNGSYDGTVSDDILAAGSTLNAGATAQIRMTVQVTNAADVGSGAGVYSAQALVNHLITGGLSYSDLSDDGTDPDPNGNGDPADSGEDDPTGIIITGNPAVGISSIAIVSGTQVRMRYFVENLGDIGLSNFSLSVPLNPVYGSGNYSIFQQPALVEGPATLLLSPQYFGLGLA